MILVSTYYKSNNSERQKELDKCLIKNIENKYIKKIYLLNDSLYDLDFINIKISINQEIPKNKVEQIIISNDKNYKLKYNDSINFINENLNDQICILSNSDIYFDNSLSKINNKIINNSLLALLRYDETIEGNKKIFKRNDYPRNDSQDCWIFRSPLKVDIDKLDFSFGTLGCDSIFANIIYESGIKLSNPCYDIITTHVHNTEYRTYNYDNRIHGVYCLVEPCHIGEDSKISFIDY